MKRIIKLINASYQFRKPKKKKILFFDTEQVNFFVKNFKIQKRNYVSLDVRFKKINLYILLKTFIKLISLSIKPSDFMFNYYLDYISFIKPNVIITLTDNLIMFYKFKKYFPEVKFLSIQLGYRTEHRDWLKKIKEKKLCKKHLKSDIYFTLNKAYGKIIAEYIDCKTIDVGSIKNNLIQLKKTKKKNSLLFISQFRYDKYVYHSEETFFLIEKNLLPKINKYCEENKLKLNILGASLKKAEEEKNYYTKILNSNNWNFLKKNLKKNNYTAVDEFENIIFIDSTLGYEAAGRGKKIAAFSSRQITKKGPPELFAWANKIKNKDFYYSDSTSEHEVKRVLNNVTKCSEKKWKEIFLPKVNIFCPYKKNNKKFREKIKQIINK